MNNQHGPDLSQAQEIIRVCTSAYPTCSIGLLDLSCGSYTNDFSAQAAIANIQRALGKGVHIDICGSGSNNVFLSCNSYRISKTYVLSPSAVTSDLGKCPEFGELCANVGERFKCKDTLNRTFTIPCCKVEGEKEIGYWGGSGGCDGRGCNEQRCPDRHVCQGNTLIMQGCTSIGPTGACLRVTHDCRAFDHVCGKKEDSVACIPHPSPSASPSPLR